MSEPASISSGIASRYAAAVFDLSAESNALEALESDISALETALDDSADLSEMIRSPLHGRDEQAAAIGAVASKMGLSDTMTNTLRLMASKRRLFVVPQMLSTLRARISEARGEVTAEVTSAKALTEAQVTNLKETLKASVGREVNIKASVDEALIGGLVIKMGSRMIDTSIASKMSQLQNTMKEAQ